MNDNYFSTEYEEIKSDEKNSYNRRKVDRIKRLIVFTFVLVCALPILFCLYLMIRMNSMESKINTLYDKLAEEEIHSESETEEVVTTDQDMMLLDQVAYEDLEIGTTEEGQMVTMLGDSEDISSDEEAGEWESIHDHATASISNGKKVYLTFDDGPSSYTDDILDVLEANNVKATFFVVHNPDETTWHAYKRIVEDGHVLAMHSYTHEYSTIYASLEAFEQDVTDIHDFLYEQTGVDCDKYRFPGGSSNSVSNVPKQDMLEFLYNEGITYYDWNALSYDAEDGSLTPQQLNDNIMGFVRSNEGDSIVLMHDLENVHTTAEALQDLIDTLKSEGYSIAPITNTTKPVQHVTYKGVDE